MNLKSLNFNKLFLAFFMIATWTFAQAAPSLSVTQTINANISSDGVLDDTGDTLDFSLIITNTGDEDLTNLVMANTLVNNSTITSMNLSPTLPNNISAGQSVTLTGSSPITDVIADISDGYIVNRVIVRAESTITPGVLVTDVNDSTPIEVAYINFAPTHTSSFVDYTSGEQRIPVAGDTQTVSLYVTNFGNINHTDITFVTNQPSFVFTNQTIPRLDVGEAISIELGYYTLTAADVDKLTSGDPLVFVEVEIGSSAPNEAISPTNIAPFVAYASETLSYGVAVTKTGVYDSASDTINYSFEVRNTSFVDLENITITDTLPGVVLTGGPIDLAAGSEPDTTTFTATYINPPTDIDIINVATVEGTTRNGRDIARSSDTATNIVSSKNPSITLVKKGAYDEATNVINYTFTVTNTGDVDLTDITITDTLAGVVLSGGPIDLAVGSAPDTTTFTAIYTPTASDITAGEVINKATVTGTPTDGSSNVTSEDTATVTLVTSGSNITLEKLGTYDSAAGIINYTFTVTNTGNVDLTDVTITDILTGVVLSGGPIDLAVGSAPDTTTFTAIYTPTAGDLTAGEVINEATVTGTPTDGSADVTADDTVTVPVTPPITPAPSITLEKLGTFDSTANVINYTFTVTNTGGVDLTDVTITDTLTGVVLSGDPIDLAVGSEDSTTFTAKLENPPANTDVVNVATVTGTPTDGSDNVSADDTVTVSVPPVVVPPVVVPPVVVPPVVVPPVVGPIILEKIGTLGDNDEIIYTFIITNDGEVELTNITLEDNLSGLTITGGPIATLAPGATDSSTFIAFYTANADDVAAGAVTNIATVIANGPNGEIESLPSEVTTDLAKPDLEVTKIGTVSADNTTINYTFMIANTGNIPLTNVTLSDDLNGVVLTGGPIASLAVGEVDDTTYSAVYTITEADFTSGKVENTATVNFTENTQDEPFQGSTTTLVSVTNPDAVNKKVPLTTWQTLLFLLATMVLLAGRYTSKKRA